MLPNMVSNRCMRTHKKLPALPLSVGNRWSFVQFTYMSGQVIEALTDSAKYEISREMLVIAEGRAHQAAVRTFTDLTTNIQSNIEWLFWNGPDGLYLLGGISDSDSNIVKHFYLKNPVAN